MSSIRDRLKKTPDAPADGPGFDQHDTRTGAAAPIEPPTGPKDERTADEKRAELAVSFLFLLSLIGAVGFVATYVAWPFKYGESGYEWFTPLLGAFMGTSGTSAASASRCSCRPIGR